jgi:hypothetical protein
MPHRHVILIALMGLAALLLPAQTIHTTDGLALSGYDPVAYFTEGSPTEGSAELTFEWMGAEWRFATRANRDAFVADPERFAPRYGGYCAWAVSEGYTAPGDPEVWAIVDDALYLNFSRGVQRRWDRDRPGHIARAEANWPGLREGLQQ